MDDRGFTLLELLVVLVILSLATGAAMLPLAGMASRAEMKEFSARLDRLLFEARTTALRTGLTTSVHLDEANRRLAVTDHDASLDIPDGVTLMIDGVSASFDAMSSDAVILFLADGSSSGGTIDIRFDGLDVKRRVSWVTGRIHAAP